MGGLERSGRAGEGGRHRLEGHVAAVREEPGGGGPRAISAQSVSTACAMTVVGTAV
ncbi:hypothetical protein [Streptomyces sp. NPDC057740]|uniref:hypothetical protein n=1 Tax=Streptomyces sp. NPDC057740 TaxID=3346234 RepID=UPI0036CA8AAC